MTRPYSLDLRKRVVRAHLAGEPIRSVAARVSVSSVPKWVALWRETGSVAPDKVGGHRSWILEPHRDLICGLIGKTPHLTIDRLQDLLAARGITVCRDTIWWFLRREGLSFKKKTLFALEQTQLPASGRGGKRQLKADRGRRPRKPPNGIKTNLAPLCGWADKGSRLKGFAPHGHWRTLTVLAALRSDGLTAPCVFDGPPGASRPGSNSSSSPP